MQSSKFYDELKELSKKKTNISERDINRTLSTISRMPRDHSSFLYALILHHSKVSQGNKKTRQRKTDIPYNGICVTKDRGIVFDLCDIPQELLAMLVTYIEMVS